MSNYRAQFFYGEAQAHRAHASALLGKQFDAGFTSYANGGYHASSFLYPFCHAAKMVASAGRIIKGSFLLLHALVNDPVTAVPQVIGGLLHEVGAMIFDAINVLASAASFVTRTLSTLFNFGYTEDVINRAGRSLNGREAGGRNEETMINMFAGMALGAASTFSTAVDADIYASTTSLSA